MNGNLFSGLLQGVSQGMLQSQVARQEKERRDLMDKMARLQAQQLEAQLKLQAADEARQAQFTTAWDQAATIPENAPIDGVGPVRPEQQRSVLDILSQPEVMRSGLQAGKVSLNDLIKLEKSKQQSGWDDPAAFAELVERLGGDMQLSTVEGTPGEAPTLRLGRKRIQQTTIVDPATGRAMPALIDLDSNEIIQAGQGLQGGPGMGGPLISKLGPAEEAALSPLGPQADNYRMPDGTIPPSVMTERDILAAGGTRISTPEVSMESTSRGARAVMGEIGPLVDRLFVAKDLPGRIGQGARNKYEQVVQNDSDVAQYDALTRGTLASIARSLGEVGALTQDDVKRIGDLIPKLTPVPDSRDVAKKKIAQINRILESALGRTGKSERQADQPAVQPKEGQVFQDAEGNKARYVNGEWVPL